MLRSTQAFLLAILCLMAIFSYTQTIPAADANLFRLNKERAIADLKNYPNPDTARVNALIRIFVTATFLKEKQEVSSYREEALALSRRLNYADGLARSYMATANLYKSASNYRLALTYYDSVLFIAANNRSRRLLELKAWTYELKGMIYHTQNNYYLALDNYFESLKYGEYNPPARNIHIYTFITEIYTNLNNLDKATEFSNKSLSLVHDDSIATVHSKVFFTAIELAFAKKDLKGAALYLDKMSRFIPMPGEVQMSFGYFMKRGQLNSFLGQYDSAYANYQKAYQFAEAGQHVNSVSTVLQALSGTALKLGRTEDARNYAIKTLAVTEKIPASSNKINAFINLSAYYNSKGDFRKAYELLETATRLKDSLLSETNVRQINTLTAIYEAEQQQREINRLQNEQQEQAAAVKQKTTLNIVFIAAIALLLVLGYLGYINFRKSQQIAQQRQSLQEQKIKELEKDQQLVAVDAMLKGQEAERGRIAKDLHDGLGGLLSGTKLSFMNVRESVAVNEDQAALFDRSFGMLDNTISDLRKVAQNLMPEALFKFGLHEAVRDYCDSIRYSSGLTVRYQELGEKRKLENTAEVFAYRIIQELVNNVIRHAQATELIVQIAMSNDRTWITVEDNGRGFDRKRLAHSKGAGMANINYRLQYFNGKIDIVTAPGNGTSVNVELTA